MKDLRTAVGPFQKDPKALLELLCANIHDDSLSWIAHADYGMGAEENLEQLKIIKRDRSIQSIKFKTIQEVLELTRWQKLVETEDKWMTDGQKSNLMIAFASTVLLMIPGKEYARLGENGSVVRLVKSSQYLERVLPDIAQKASQLLAWRVTENETDPEVVPFFLFGLVLTLLMCSKYKEAQMVELISELLRLEEELYYKGQGPDGVSVCLFRITYYDDSGRDIWRSFRPLLEAESNRAKTPGLKDRLNELSERLDAR